MSFIDDFINAFVGGNANSAAVQQNTNEFNGNAGTVLFSTDQPATALAISGGTTNTSISPVSTLVNPSGALDDLTSGKITGRALVLLAMIIAIVWYLRNK